MQYWAEVEVAQALEMSRVMALHGSGQGAVKVPLSFRYLSGLNEVPHSVGE